MTRQNRAPRLGLLGDTRQPGPCCSMLHVGPVATTPLTRTAGPGVCRQASSRSRSERARFLQRGQESSLPKRPGGGAWAWQTRKWLIGAVSWEDKWPSGRWIRRRVDGDARAYLRLPGHLLDRRSPELGVTARLAVGPRTPAELARECGVFEGPLYRMLRALAGKVSSPRPMMARFSLTPMAELCALTIPDPLRNWAINLGALPFRVCGKCA